MSKKYIAQNDVHNFVYANNTLAQYDTEIIHDLKEDVKEIERGYVMKDDYRIDIAEIKGMLARIFDKLDLKADK